MMIDEDLVSVIEKIEKLKVKSANLQCSWNGTFHDLYISSILNLLMK